MVAHTQFKVSVARPHTLTIMLARLEVSLEFWGKFVKHPWLVVVFFSGLLVRGQEAQLPANAKNSGDQSASTSSSATPAPDIQTFKVNVNYVPVRVVVRDAHGQTVGNLHKEDFQIFDRGKPQVISQFSVEQAKKEQQGSNGATVPDRFVVYVFDDVHLAFGDLAHARDAFEHHVNSLRPADRAAIVTTSGGTILNFTDDKTRLRRVSELVRPAPSGGASVCPKVSYYMADQIVNKHFGINSNGLILEAGRCGIPPKSVPQMVSAIAQVELARGEQETRNTLAALRYVVQAISSLPGQRVIILVSPGFITPELEYEYSALIDEALRAEVIISTLDARGVYVILPNDSEEEEKADGRILSALAEGTGGVLFQSNNDLEEGFGLLAVPPDYAYFLGFAPQGIKADGKFHKLRVTGPQHLTLQARPGYSAPKRLRESQSAR